MESIITDFHVDWRLLLAQLVNFSVVVAILYYFVFKPVISKMTERSDRIAQGLKDAENSRLSFDNSELEASRLIKDARAQSEAIIVEANRRAIDNQTATIKATKEQIATVIRQEKEQIAQERAQVEKELRLEGLALATELAEKILSRKMDAAGDDDFINKITK